MYSDAESLSAHRLPSLNTLQGAFAALECNSFVKHVKISEGKWMEYFRHQPGWHKYDEMCPEEIKAAPTEVRDGGQRQIPARAENVKSFDVHLHNCGLCK